MVNQTKQRNLRRSTSKKTKSRTRKHANRRVSLSNKMRGGGEKIELELKTRNTVNDPYVFICNDTTENGVNIGFTIGKEYTLITGEFPLKGMAENTRSDNEYKTADENIINNVYTFRDTNKTLITDIRIKNYKDYCRNFRLNTDGICSITVAQELIQLKVRGKNLFECIETTDNGTKIGFSKDKIYSIEGGIMDTVFDKNKVYNTNYTFKRVGAPPEPTINNIYIPSINNIYITKLSENFPNNIDEMVGTGKSYTFNVDVAQRRIKDIVMTTNSSNS